MVTAPCVKFMHFKMGNSSVWDSQARIQDSEGGGGVVHSEGGGGSYRIQIVAGSWANQQAKKIADSRGGGGGSDHPKNLPVYPRMNISCACRTLTGVVNP